MSKLRTLMTAGAAGAASVALVGVAAVPAGATSNSSVQTRATASARPAVQTVDVVAAWANCPKGYVCFYSGANGFGSVCRSEGNSPNSSCGTRRSYFNNGYVQSGADHVRVYRSAGYSGFIKCLHQGAKGNLGTVNVGSYKWGGEC